MSEAITGSFWPDMSKATAIRFIVTRAGDEKLIAVALFTLTLSAEFRKL